MTEQAQANGLRAMLLMRTLRHHGVRDFVLSPGSRNTPMILALEALAEGDSEIRLHRILDERSAAFFALGLGRASGKPAALVCTSGTAGAHYLPAVIEADQSYVPMLVLTADRPEELHGCGALQTVEQEDFYGTHTRLTITFTAPAPDESERAGWFVGSLTRALDAAVGAKPGPVHLNLPFREPLWDEDVAYGDLGLLPLAPALTRGAPQLDDAQASRLRALVDSHSNGVIVAGPMHGPRSGESSELRELLVRVARERGWPIIAEPDSGLRFGAGLQDVVSSRADIFLRDRAVCKALAPDLVIRLGQTPTSKPVRHWLRDYAAGAVVLVDQFGTWQDPDHVARELVVAAPTDFVRMCLLGDDKHEIDSPWARLWRRAESAACGELEGISCEQPWEGAAAHELVKCLPAGALVHVANSMPIRDLDGFGGVRSDFIEVFSNRGANGIDGMVSTAAGEAVGRGAPLVAYSGDLTALHDLSGLLVAHQAGASVTLAVVDNRGGGIFEHLPISKHPHAFEKNFITPHQQDVAAVASAMGIRAMHVTSVRDFSAALIEEFERPGLSVVVLRVDRQFNTQQHRRAWESVGQRVREELGL